MHYNDLYSFCFNMFEFFPVYIIFICLQGGEKHPGMNLLYEYHSNQTGDSENVLMHALGHWRLTKHFHDLVFLPQVTVSLNGPRREKTYLRGFRES